MSGRRSAVRLRPALQQRLAEHQVTVRRRLVEGRPATGLDDVRVGAPVEQQYRHRGLAPRRRAVERGDVAQPRVRRPRLDVRATVEQQLGGVETTEVGGEMERRESVLREGVRPLRTAAERPSQRLDVTDRRGIECVESRAALEDEARQLVIARVERPPERRQAFVVAGVDRLGLPRELALDPPRVTRGDRVEDRGACDCRSLPRVQVRAGR